MVEPTYDLNGLNVLWSEHRNFKEQVNKKFESIDAEIEDMKTYLMGQDKKFDSKFQTFDDKFTAKFSALDDKIERKMDALNSSLNQVTSNAINAMPKWAVEAMDRKNLMIGGLFTVLASAIGYLLATVHLH